MATFHVDYINGSNSNDGSAANPYATMKYALETNSMGTGDDLKVAGSALTTRESAATFDQANGNNLLTTSTDLTGSISVGDIVQINPPSVTTQFQDWVVCQVTAITATTITFYEEVHLPGTMASGSWTIKTIDSVYVNSSGTQEDWADATVGANVSIVGGYNSTFTSIIGLTYFRRGGLGAGSSSGKCIGNKYPNNSLAIAEFKNFQFMQWNQPIRGEFGGSIYGTNLRAYMQTSTIFAYFGTVLGKGYVPDTYYINCAGSTGAYAYLSNAAADATVSLKQNVKTFCSHKAINQEACFNDLTIWNPGQNANGGDFGATYSVKVTDKAQVNGVLTFNTIDNARSGFRKGHNLFDLQGTMTAKPTAINVLNGGLAESFWDFSDSQASKMTAFISTVMCPSGFLITDQAIRSGRDAAINVQPVMQVVDATGTWIKMSGGYISVSTTEFDTGDSSKVYFLANGLSYATGNCLGLIFEYIKLAANPTSITVRAKLDANGHTQNSVELQPQIANYKEFSSLGNVTFTTSGFSDQNISIPSGYTYDQIPTGSPVQIGAVFNSSRNQILYIDSITVNY